MPRSFLVKKKNKDIHKRNGQKSESRSSKEDATVPLSISEKDQKDKTEESSHSEVEFNEEEEYSDDSEEETFRYSENEESGKTEPCRDHSETDATDLQQQTSPSPRAGLAEPHHRVPARQQGNLSLEIKQNNINEDIQHDRHTDLPHFNNHDLQIKTEKEDEPSLKNHGYVRFRPYIIPNMGPKLSHETHSETFYPRYKTLGSKPCQGLGSSATLPHEREHYVTIKQESDNFRVAELSNKDPKDLDRNSEGVSEDFQADSDQSRWSSCSSSSRDEMLTSPEAKTPHSDKWGHSTLEASSPPESRRMTDPFISPQQPQLPGREDARQLHHRLCSYPARSLPHSPAQHSPIHAHSTPSIGHSPLSHSPLNQPINHSPVNHTPMSNRQYPIQKSPIRSPIARAHIYRDPYIGLVYPTMKSQHDAPPRITDTTNHVFPPRSESHPHNSNPKLSEFGPKVADGPRGSDFLRHPAFWPSLPNLPTLNNRHLYLDLSFRRLQQMHYNAEGYKLGALPPGYSPTCTPMTPYNQALPTYISNSEKYYKEKYHKETEFEEKDQESQEDEKSKKDSDPPRFNCDGCGKSYSTFSGLSKHKQFHCSSHVKKQFSCKYCEKTYVSLGALKMHIRTHTLPCKCPLCGKCFSRPWLLQGHIRTHTGEKPFRCPHCARAFADRSNLRAHLQTHSEVKKYNCKTCSKTFSRMSLLLKHEDGGCSSSR